MKEKAKDRIDKDMGNRLKEARKAKRATQKEIADNLGMTANAYQLYEYGHEISSGRLVQICAILECSPNWLLGVRDEGMQLPPDSLLLRRLKEAFDSMNTEGQNEAVKRVEELCELERYKKKDLDAEGDSGSEVA